MTKAMRAAILGGAALCAAAGQARAENWVTFFLIPQGVIYLDHDSIAKRPGHISARLESTFPKPQLLDHNGAIFTYIKTIDAVDVDCRARVYINVSRDLYSDKGLRQLLLNEQDSPLPVLDDSPQAALIKSYCS